MQKSLTTSSTWYKVYSFSIYHEESPLRWAFPFINTMMNAEKEIKELKEEIIRLKKVVSILQGHIKMLDGKIVRSNLLIRESKANIEKLRNRR